MCFDDACECIFRANFRRSSTKEEICAQEYPKSGLRGMMYGEMPGRCRLQTRVSDRCQGPETDQTPIRAVVVVSKRVSSVHSEPVSVLHETRYVYKSLAGPLHFAPLQYVLSYVGISLPCEQIVLKYSPYLLLFLLKDVCDICRRR